MGTDRGVVAPLWGGRGECVCVCVCALCDEHPEWGWLGCSGLSPAPKLLLRTKCPCGSVQPL